MVAAVRAVIGIDVGTTAVKAMLVDTQGIILAEGEVEHPISVPRPGWSEQHPEMWWQSTVTAVRDVLQSADQNNLKVEVKSIGLSGQMHSSVFLGANGEVIRPALLWNDVRTTAQCEEILDRAGIEGLRNTVGNLPLEGFTAPKLLWLRENEPDNYSRLCTLLPPKDYIRFLMCGEYATEPSDAAGTLLYDVHGRYWSKQMLDALEVDEGILPRIVESTEVSGSVTAEAAGELGVPAGIPVVGGGADNAAGAVGCGATNNTVLQASIGTSGALVLPSSQPRVAQDMNLHTFCHAAPEMWYLMGVVLSAGSSLRWLRDTIAPGSSYDSLTAEAENIAVGSEGLMFLPYLSGERTPHNDANARGVFFGLSFAHGLGHLTRAVIEGVCFAMRDSLELMKLQGISPSEVRAIGGGARSRMWLQTLANAFGLPISTVEPAGGAGYGAALLAAVGSGVFDSVEDAVRTCIRTQRAVDPDNRVVAMYEDMYSAYRRLYPALKQEFASLTEVAAAHR